MKSSSKNKKQRQIIIERIREIKKLCDELEYKKPPTTFKLINDYEIGLLRVVLQRRFDGELFTISVAFAFSEIYRLRYVYDVFFTKTINHMQEQIEEHECILSSI